MSNRTLWLLLGWLWFWLTPAAARAATWQEGTCSVDISQKCASKTGEMVTFTFNLDTGETTHYVYVHDFNGASIVTLRRDEHQSPTSSLTAGVDTQRFLTRAWCKHFRADRRTEAEAAHAAVSAQVAVIQSLRSSHSQIRAMIETLEQTLITAVEFDNQASVNSTRQQIIQLEQNDDSILQSIKGAQDSITSTLGQFPDKEGAIAKLKLVPFNVKDDFVSGVSPAGTQRYASLQGGAKDNPGQDVWVNDDDDNQNDTPDKDDTGVTGEDELAPLWWFLAKPIEAPQGLSPWEFKIELNSGVLKFWNGRTKDSAVQVPKRISDNYSYDSVYVEGTAASGADRAENIKVDVAGDAHCQDTAQATALAIEFVDFEEGPAGLGNFEKADAVTKSFAIITPRQDPIEGGEYRLFPDKNFPSDVPHQVVDVRVKVTPAKSVRIWARPYDVDDPSSDDPILDDESQESDNRLTPGRGGRKAGLAKRTDGSTADADGVINENTNAGGEAVLRLDVSDAQQPGNNFRMVAGMHKGAVLNGIVVRRPDPKAKLHDAPLLPLGAKLKEKADPPALRKQSPLLTIWRFLHFELDSMGPRVNNFATATVKKVRTHKGVSILDLENIQNGTVIGDTGPLDTSGVIGRFAGGNIINAAKSAAFAVDSNTADLIKINAAVPRNWRNDEVVVLDDDSVGGPLPLPDTSLLQESDDELENLLAIVYIRPKHDGAGDPGNQNNQVGQLPYRMNIEFADTLAGINAGRTSQGNQTRDYWVAYIQTVYQAGIQEDRDPNLEEGRNPGVNLGRTVSEGPTKSAGSIIDLEVIADMANFPLGMPGVNMTDLFKHTVAHELGHQLNADHGDDGIMGPAVGFPPGYGTGAFLGYTVKSRAKIRVLPFPNRP